MKKPKVVKKRLIPKPPQPTIQDLQVALWSLDILNAEAAALVGVSERTLYRYLSGDTPIPYSVMQMLCLTLELRKTSVEA
jgi:hypothetical protein